MSMLALLPMFLLRVAVFAAGALVVGRSLLAVVRTFVLPRAETDEVVRTTFVVIRSAFEWRLRQLPDYESRDGLMALYAPISLMTLPFVMMGMVLIGFTGMYWALGGFGLYNALMLSGSSLLTLGFHQSNRPDALALEFLEAMIGLMLVALLIAYMPTIYSAFSRREAMVAQLEVRAGSPPSAITMIERYHRLHHMDILADQWVLWEAWFLELEETHTSIAAVSFFRSPQPDRSWVTAAGTVLDGAALTLACLDLPDDARPALCLRAGYIALRRLADLFRIPYDPNPGQGDPISILRWEFDEAYDQLLAAGLPMKPDRDRCWRDFAGWRVNYDTVLLQLASLLMVPFAPWSSDRSPIFQRPSILRWFRSKHKR